MLARHRRQFLELWPNPTARGAMIHYVPPQYVPPRRTCMCGHPDEQGPGGLPAEHSYDPRFPCWIPEIRFT